MAINLALTYPGKTEPGSTPYPYGKARNVTSPLDGTGTPWEAAIVNDIVGFLQGLLSYTGTVPTNNPDSATASQYRDSLRVMFPEAKIYGLGTTIAYPPGFNLGLTDNSVNTGLYKYDSNFVADTPTTGDGFVMWTRRGVTGGETQVAVSEGGTPEMFFRSRQSGPWQAWQSVYTGANFPGTTSNVDATPGRYTKVGDFGLGGTTPLPPGNDLDLVDNSVSTGMYSFGNTTGGNPTGTGGGTVLWTRRSSGGGEAQFAISENGDRMFFRSRIVGAWEPWSEPYTKDNILGDVSAGKIIERGNNATGSYTLFADGTLECWTNNANVTDTNGALTWTFPYPFVASPNVSALGASTASDSFVLANFTDRTATGVDIACVRLNFTTQTFLKQQVAVMLSAKGRAF